MLKLSQGTGLRLRGTRRGRVQGKKDHRIFPKVNSELIFVFEAEVTDHSVSLLVSHKTLLLRLPDISVPFFLEDNICSFLYPSPPVFFPSSLSKWAGTQCPAVRCSVTQADRE